MKRATFHVLIAALLLALAIAFPASADVVDRDGDGMDDSWEASNGLPVGENDGGRDPDSDRVSNLMEYRHTPPTCGERGGTRSEQRICGSLSSYPGYGRWRCSVNVARPGA